jgi:hypothetical protein
MSIKGRMVAVLGVCLIVVGGLFGGVLAADSSSGFDALSKIGQDAAKGFVGPFVTLIGTGMNSGWYNSSKSLSMFKLPVGISVASISAPFINIDDKMRTFKFEGTLPVADMVDPMLPTGGKMKNIKDGTVLSPPVPGLQLSIPFSADSVPTIFGSDSGRKVTLKELFSQANDTTKDVLFKSHTYFSVFYPAQLDSTDSIPLPFTGLNWQGIMPGIPAVTAITVGVKNIPVIDNIQLGLRFIPEIDLSSFGMDGLPKVSQLGVKVQYEFTQWLPVMGSVPFIHTSAFWAMNNLKLTADSSSLTQSNWIAMVNVSADAKLPVIGAGIFMGVGIEKSNLLLDVKMPAASGVPNFSVDIPGDNSFRFQVGPRFSIANFDIWGEVNLGSVTSYAVGVTVIGLNGL